MPRASPATSCGRPGWRTRGGGRSATNTRRAPKIRPIDRGDVTRATNSWDAPEIGRPGVKTFGLNSSKGVYAGWGGCTPRGARGFPIYRPEHWAFADTGLFYGDLLGADSHIYGYEVDGLDYEIRNGRPYPSADQRRAGGARNPGPRHGQPGRGGRFPCGRGPVLRRRGRALHRRDAAWRRQRRESGKGPLLERHDRQLQARARARCFTREAANGSPGSSAATPWWNA